MTLKPLLENLLPHKPPMLFLDSILFVDAERSSCTAIVSKGMPFLDDNGNLPSWVGIELMAQTIAVWGGHYSKSISRDADIGLLLGSRKYITELDVFPFGVHMIVNAEKIIQDGNMGVFQCSIHLDDKTVASAQVSTYLPDKEELMKILEREV